MQNTDSPAVLQTAQEKGKHAFGWDSDMTAYGPKAHLGSAVINWGAVLRQCGRRRARRQVEDRAVVVGRQGRRDRHRLDRPTRCRPTLKAKVEKVKAGLKDGSFVIWKGPIVDNTGKTVLEKDKVADDKFLGGIKFFVKGVEGKVPGEK